MNASQQPHNNVTAEVRKSNFVTVPPSRMHRVAMLEI